jgi:hypothetical protein
MYKAGRRAEGSFGEWPPHIFLNFAFDCSTMLSSIRTSVSKSQRHVLVSLEVTVEMSTESVDDGKIVRAEQVENKTMYK